MTTAFASCGTLYFSSYQKAILTRSASGWMLSILPTGTPRIRTSSPTKTPLLLSKYATTFTRPTPVADLNTIASPATRVTASRMASPIRVYRGFRITVPLPEQVAPHRAQAR